MEGRHQPPEAAEVSWQRCKGADKRHFDTYMGASGKLQQAKGTWRSDVGHGSLKASEAVLLQLA